MSSVDTTENNMTPFQIKCPWKIRESELMARSRHLGKVPVKTRVKSKRDATACLQSYFEDQKTRAAFVFDGETGEHRWSVSSSCLCILCVYSLFRWSESCIQSPSPSVQFHQLPVGWLGSALPEWSSSVLSQSESSYRPWWGGKTARCEESQPSIILKQLIVKRSSRSLNNGEM